MSSDGMARSSIVFDHIGFITPSVEQSVEFWTTVLGFRSEPIGERSQSWLAKFIGVPDARIRLAHLFGHGAHIEFIEFVFPAAERSSSTINQLGIAHVCLKVTSLNAMRQKILDAEGALQGEIAEISEGVARGLRGLYMRDPHGILIELIENPAAPIESG